MDSLGIGIGAEFLDWTVSEPESESKKLEPGTSDQDLFFNRVSKGWQDEQFAPAPWQMTTILLLHGSGKIQILLTQSNTDISYTSTQINMLVE